MTKRGRPRDPEADERIRRAAAELLLEQGFERMSVDDIALRAHVGKATVYRRWSSKEALAYDAFATFFDVEIPNPDTGTIEGDLTQVYGDIVGFFGTPRGAAFLRMAVTEAARDPRNAALYRRTVESRNEQGRVVFDRAIARGEIRSDSDPREVTEIVLGTLVLRVIIGTALPTAADIPDMVRFTLDGIRTKP